MKIYKIMISCVFITIISVLPLFAIELKLGEDEQSLGFKADGTLRCGPSSIRFYNSNIWIADSLKQRIVEFDLEGNYIKSINLKYSKSIFINDFCFGNFENENVIFVSDENIRTIGVFDFDGMLIKELKFMMVNNPGRIEYYNDFIYIYDSKWNNIMEYKLNVGQRKALSVCKKNFNIENGMLYSISEGNKELCDLSCFDLEKIDTDYNFMKIDKAPDFDFIGFYNGHAYIGVGDTENHQYQLIKISKDGKKSILNTTLPVSFMIRSFIPDSNGNLFQIKFDNNNPTKLVIDKLPETF